MSKDILDEYQNVLARPKFGLPPDLRERWQQALTQLTTLVEVRLSVHWSRDQKDARFVACALAADVNYLLTGDKDLTQAKMIGNTTILSVGMFKRLVCDTAQ